MKETRQNPDQLLDACIVHSDELTRVIADRRITLETLVAVGVNDGGEAELRWVAYPAKLTDKIAIPLKPTPGFAYFASIQAMANWPHILVEGERAAIQNPHAPKIARQIVQSLPATTKRRAKPVFDLHLVACADRERIESAKMADNRAEPLFTGTDANEFRHPRLTPTAIFAAKGNRVVAFEWNGKAYEHRTERAATLHAFSDRIRYLSRVHQDKRSLVITTGNGRTFALDTAVTDGKGNRQVKVLAEAETGADFVGTPGGNGLEICLEIGRQNNEPTLFMWPKTTPHTAAIVQAAC